MAQPDTSYRAGIDILHVRAPDKVRALLVSNPEHVAAARAESAHLAAEDAAGQIFSRCYISKTTHRVLSQALGQLGEST